MSNADADVSGLVDLEERGEYDAVISGLRERVAADRRTMTDPWVKAWCGRRWRDLFLTEASKDDRAVKVASQRLGIAGVRPVMKLGSDQRPVRQRLAERFLAADVDDWQLELPEADPPAGTDTTLVFCPGFVHTAIPVLGLDPELTTIRDTYGMPVLRAPAHALRGCEANVADLLDAVERGMGQDSNGVPIDDPTTPGDVVLLGYSKGAPDALTLLAHEPRVAPRVRALVSWAGAVGGSPSADDIHGLIKNLPLGQVANNDVVATMLKALLPIAQLDGLMVRREEADFVTAVRDLTTVERQRFLDEHADTIDALDVPVFNVVGQTSPLDVPFFQVQGAVEIGRRAGVNDMQVAVDHAQLRSPMATTLAVCRAHHWDLALGAFPMSHRLGSPNLDNPFPRLAAVTATVLLLAELGLV